MTHKQEAVHSAKKGGHRSARTDPLRTRNGQPVKVLRRGTVERTGSQPVLRDEEGFEVRFAYRCVKKVFGGSKPHVEVGDVMDYRLELKYNHSRKGPCSQNKPSYRATTLRKLNHKSESADSPRTAVSESESAAATPNSNSMNSNATHPLRDSRLAVFLSLDGCGEAESISHSGSDSPSLYAHDTPCSPCGSEVNLYTHDPYSPTGRCYFSGPPLSVASDLATPYSTIDLPSPMRA